ncbi:hypothetical protein C7S17_1671 [Burkholderia thailandensis]|nr:hypothetical protein [Burkholderia thailandensis]
MRGVKRGDFENGHRGPRQGGRDLARARKQNGNSANRRRVKPPAMRACPSVLDT